MDTKGAAVLRAACPAAPPTSGTPTGGPPGEPGPGATGGVWSRLTGSASPRAGPPARGRPPAPPADRRRADAKIDVVSAPASGTARRRLRHARWRGRPGSRPAALLLRWR